MTPEQAANVIFSMGPRRPNPPDPRVVSGLQTLAANILGPGATVKITSGTGEYGSPRHRGGLAADVTFLDPQGNVVTIGDQRMRQLALAAPQYGFRGFGAGEEYMGSSSVHLDMFPHEQYTSDMAPTWGSFGRGIRDDFVAAISGQPVAAFQGQQAAQPAPSGLMLSDRISTQGAPMAGLMDFAPEPEPQNWRERIAQSWQSGELPDRLTLALNSLRMRPDQGLAQAVMARQEQRSQERQANRTAEWLASMGRTDLAQAIATGALDARSAAVIAMTPEPVQPPVEGKVVGNNLVNPYTGQVIYEGPQTVEPNAAERDIALLQEIGLSRADAIRVSQLVTVSQNPITGEAILIDRSTGQPYAGVEGQPETTIPQQPQEAPEQTEPIVPGYADEFPNAPGAFGGPGFLRWLANKTSGVVGAPPLFPSVQETTASINVLREYLLRGVALAYQRQPNESLMSRIHELTPEPGSPFESASNAVAKLDALSSAFQMELNFVKEALQGDLSPALRLENQVKERELTAGLMRISALRNALAPQEDSAISQTVADRLSAYE
jgi:hypothetical protein